MTRYASFAKPMIHGKAIPDPVGSGADGDARAAGELLRLMRLVDPSFDTTTRLTFDPVPGPAPARWAAWAGTVYLDGLFPLLSEIIQASGSEHASDILAIDREMDGVLSAEAAARSQIHGWRLLRDYRPPRGARALGKLREWSLDQGRGLHYATVFATRCGVFSIPVPQAGAAYQYKEWQCGFEGRLPLAVLPEACQSPPATEDCQPLFRIH